MWRSDRRPLKPTREVTREPGKVALVRTIPMQKECDDRSLRGVGRLEVNQHHASPAEYTRAPSTKVCNTRVLAISSTGCANGSRSSTARSAYLPTSIVPVR